MDLFSKAFWSLFTGSNYFKDSRIVSKQVVSVRTERHGHEEIQDSDLTYAQTHLDLSEDRIHKALNNPDLTFKECDALYFSLCNDPENFGINHPLVDEVLRKQGELVCK